MQLEKSGVYALVALIVIVIVALGMYAFKHDLERMFSQPKVVEIGDCVEVNYIARYASNGTVFDTSYENVAKENGIYDKNKTYEPLKIFVDPEGSIEKPKGYDDFSSYPPLGMKKGFVKYLIGMKEGEEKIVTLPPDEAYGIWNESLAKDFGMDRMPRYQKLNCTEKINRTQFSYIFPNISIEKNVTFNFLAQNETEGTLNATIIDVDNQNVTIKFFPVNGTTFVDPYSKVNVTIFYKEGSDNFTLWYDFKVNQTFTQFNIFGYPIHLKVIGVNQTMVRFAVNLYAPKISLVDQPVEISIKVEKIYKTSKES